VLLHVHSYNICYRLTYIVLNDYVHGPGCGYCNLSSLFYFIDATSQVALNALLERSREVLVQFTKDEALAGDCPLPRLNFYECLHTYT